MSEYRRARQAGGSYFFTVVTHQRKPIFNKEENVEILRQSFRHVMQDKPFGLEAIVILPDHLHCIWQLPESDADYSGRWREIKKYTTKQLSGNRNHRGEGGIWQRRFWEHQIRDEKDWRIHMDYIHYNPVKHGYVSAPKFWKNSSFIKWVALSAYEIDWGSSVPGNLHGLDFE